MQKFAKESKALNTTVLVVGAVALCINSARGFCFLFLFFLKLNAINEATRVLVRTFAMLNSFVKSTDLLLAAERDEAVCISSFVSSFGTSAELIITLEKPLNNNLASVLMLIVFLINNNKNNQLGI